MFNINVAMFTTPDANESTNLTAYLAKARHLLPRDMRIVLFQTTPGSDTPRTLPYTRSVNDEKDGGKLRALCHQAVPQGVGIPVIFCKFFQARDLGVTVLNGAPQNDGIGWLPYILINTRLKAWRNGTLLHELIHAAYGDFQPHPGRDPHDTDTSSVFYDDDWDVPQPGVSPQFRLPFEQISPPRRAYFTTYSP